MNSQHIPVLSKRELRLRESANRNRVSYVMTILRSPWHKTANAIFLTCRPAWFSRAAVSAQRLRAQAAFILLDLLSQREAYEFAPAGEVSDQVSPGGFSMLRARRWHMVLGVRKTLIRYWETAFSEPWTSEYSDVRQREGKWHSLPLIKLAFVSCPAVQTGSLQTQWFISRKHGR